MNKLWVERGWSKCSTRATREIPWCWPCIEYSMTADAFRHLPFGYCISEAMLASPRQVLAMFLRAI